MTKIDDLMLLHGTNDMAGFIAMNIYDAMDVLKEHKAYRFNIPQTIDFHLNFDNKFNIIQDDQLPRHYENVTPNDATHAYACFMAYQAFNAGNYHFGSEVDIPIRLNIMKDLLSNKEQYGLRDSDIVQFFVEMNYQTNDVSTDILKHILKHCDLSSDTQGYMIQIICVNGLSEFLSPAISAGSSVDGFFERYENQSLWITQEQEEELIEANYNAYNLYTKFDLFMNNADTTVLEMAQEARKSIQLYRKLGDTLDGTDELQAVRPKI